jgi:hypothetical protein
MAQSKSRSWKMERANVHTSGSSRPRSNKYSGSDTSVKPAAGTREKVWVGGYRKADGTEVAGHYRKLNHGSA